MEEKFIHSLRRRTRHPSRRLRGIKISKYENENVNHLPSIVLDDLNFRPFHERMLTLADPECGNISIEQGRTLGQVRTAVRK